MKIVCVAILIFSGFMETKSENFKVVGPTAPLVAEAGEDLVLPCSLQPNISAVDMMVVWIRTDQTDTDKLVHLYRDHGDRNDLQMGSYRGRTALFKEELQKGNTSLKLSVVQTSDEGVYRCSVESASSSYGNITVHLFQVKVHSKVVGPAAPLVVEAGEDLVLPCSLQPNISAEDMMVEWIRTDLTETDKLVHLYEDHEDNNYDQMVTYRGRTALIKAELQKGNTSLKLSAVQPSDEGVYKCLIRYRSWFDDIPVYVEVKEGFHAWKIAVICFFVFAVILGALTAYIWKDKSSKKELSPAQCSAVAYMRLKSQYMREELNLKKYNTSEEGYRRLIPAMTNCRKAKFAGCNLTVQSIKTLSAALQTENSLKELDLSNNNLQDSAIKLLSAGLKSSHCKLKTLRLASCNLEEKTCEELESVLELETSSLKELDIGNNYLQDSGVALLSAGLKSAHCKLEVLRLALCNFGEKSCENLGSVLQTETSSLKELDISNNELHDSGVELLSAGLKSSHCKLEILRLSGCMVRKEGCSSLASALSSNPSHLKELDVSYNLLGESGVKLLSARLEDPHFSLSTLRVEHQGEMRIRPKKYSCEFTLDPNTANRFLSVSEGNKKVERVWDDQSYPDHPERFGQWYQVLCRESVTGRCYWEAEWSGWRVDIAVTYKSISRKGDSYDSEFGGNEKSWILICSDKSYSVRHKNKITELPARPSSSDRVGVYVDCLAGTLSFYRVSSDTRTLTHLHTLNITFTEPLYAGFWVGSNSSVCLR